MSRFRFIWCQHFIFYICMGVFCFHSPSSSASPIDKTKAEFYINEYGVLPPTHSAAVKQAYIVFNRLIKASTHQSEKKINLVVLPKTASNWENWAFSLPDNSIILVENLLEFCFQNEQLGTDQSDARVAFILAHELSHVLDNHHTHLEHGQVLPFQTLSDKNTNTIQHIEANADYSGLILMSMAAYQPQYIINETNFFLEYIQKVRSNFVFDQHHTPQVRNAELLKNLLPVVEKLPLFSEGLEFYDQQAYEKSISKFIEFAEVFPGREVFNNIGLAYYQLALKELSLVEPNSLFRFALATQIDRNTLASNLIPGDLGKSRKLETKYNEYLEKAEENLNLSIAKDTGYLPARINLSSILIGKQEYQKALEILDESLAQQPENADMLSNKAVALYLSAPEENSNRAISILELLNSNEQIKVQRKARYNASRIRQERLGCDSAIALSQNDQCLMLAKKSWSPYFHLDNSTIYAQRIQRELALNKENNTPRKENKRIALVIGNGSYIDNPLLNPLNDATSMRNKLEKLGFKVHLGLDLQKSDLVHLINHFVDQLTADSTGLVYYSGHGLQVNGENFLLPIDILTVGTTENSPYTVSRQIQNQAVSLSWILSKLASVNNVQNIIILDACRENPLSGLDESYQGFAETNAPPRTYIAYSTSPGKIAWDGLEGNHGVYTQALLDHLGKVNLDINSLFQEVRKDVSLKTAGNQTTWDVSTLNEEYYFNPAKQQDWTWHLTAGTLAFLSAWKSVEEARSYRQLNEKNKVLKEKYSSSIELEEYLKVREQYYVNQEKMRTHKRNYQYLDGLTVVALLWELYLLIFETYDEGIYQMEEDSIENGLTFHLIQPIHTYGFTLQWRW